MVSAFTPNKHVEQPGFNDYIDSWDVPLNADLGIFDTALGGIYTLNAAGLSGNQTLTATQYQPLKIRVTGLPVGAIHVRIPSGVGGIWVARNDTTGGFAITIESVAGGAQITIPAGQNTLVTCDGTALGMFQAINTAGTAAGSTTQVQFNNAGVLGGSAGLTWDGTTLTSTGLATTGNTVLGDAAGDTLALNGTAVTAANGLAVNTNQLFLNAAGTKVAVGTITPGTSMLTVAGAIESTAGGFVFPDGSVQTSSASSPVGTVVATVAATPPAGWILGFGSIGSAASAATNRANADTATLYALLWNDWANGQAAVSGGRGANAAADFAANKTIAISDLRGRTAIGRDNMGGTAAGRATALTVSPNGQTLGATGGTETQQFAVSVSGTAFTNGLGGTAFTVGLPVNSGGSITSASLGGLQGGGGITAAQFGDSTAETGTVAGNCGIQVSGNATMSGTGATDVRSTINPGIILNMIVKL